MSKPITMDGEYVTRDGREVRVLCVDLNHPEFTVAAITQGASGFDVLRQYRRNGRYWDHSESDLDLIPKPKRHKRTVWVNVYGNPNAHYGVHPSRSLADASAAHGRTACLELHLDFAEGEGLEP